jgi:hypothetical protein
MLKRLLTLLPLALVLSAPAAADPRTFFEPGQYPYSGSRGAFAPPFASYREDVVLAADTLQRVPIPAGAKIVVFSFDGNVRVKLGGAASTFSLPSATSTTGEGSALNPGARYIPDTLADGSTPTHILLRAPSAVSGSIEFYRGG